MCAEPNVERRASIRSAVTRSELCADYCVRTPSELDAGPPRPASGVTSFHGPIFPENIFRNRRAFTGEEKPILCTVAFNDINGLARSGLERGEMTQDVVFEPSRTRRSWRPARRSSPGAR